MEKKYIKPNTALCKIQEVHALLAGSVEIKNGTLSDPSAGDAKQFDFVTEEEAAWKNEYPAFSLWED